MKKPAYMGVDIGTSGCKAVIFDENGQQISIAYREYSLISKHPGWAELNPEEIIEKCFEVIAEATRMAPDSSVRGLGISSQGEALHPLTNTVTPLQLPWFLQITEQKPM